MCDARTVSIVWTAAPPGAWREFDPAAPDPGYFEFDWLSARHPDLYDAFALSTVGLVEELCAIFDFEGATVADIGAGHRSFDDWHCSQSRHVIAIDAFSAVCEFGVHRAHDQGVSNGSYLIGDRARLPLADNSVDHCVACWADLDRREAYRIVKPGGYIFHGGGTGATEGGLGRVLREDFPDLVPEALRAPLPDTTVTATFENAAFADVASSTMN